jgi:DNA-binding response OmpR family regulator
MNQILLIEDDLINQKLVVSSLSNHQIKAVASLAEARKELALNNYDLIILDIGLPDGDGFSFLLEIQQTQANSNLLIVLLTGKDAANDKVVGYTLGADDYFTKPINHIVFKARIEAMLQKKDKSNLKKDTLVKDSFVISFSKQTVSYEGKNGLEKIDMTSLEFKLFVYFFERKDQVLSREQLIHDIWGDRINISDRTIDSHISRLRKHLSNSNITIQSIYSAGYKLSVIPKAA